LTYHRSRRIMPSTHVNHTRLQRTARTTLRRCTRSSRITRQSVTGIRLAFATRARRALGFLIKSPNTYKTWGRKDAHMHPAGTGPFKLVRWEPNQLISRPRGWITEADDRR